MDSKINIRKAKKEDIPRLLELLTQVDMVHHKGRPDLFKGGVTKYTKEQLEDILEKEDVKVFVCEDHPGNVVAHAFCVEETIRDSQVLTDVKTLYIDDICIDESSRGQGIGREMYRFIKEYAGAENFYRITLNVYCFNQDAVKFYEAMGMKALKVGMEELL